MKNDLKRHPSYIKPRKRPFQKRSQKRVKNILNATIILLETKGIEGVTTHHIAKEAGISVASLYQYFPNKQAVIYVLFQKWLDWVVDRIDKIESEYYLNMPCEDFFDRLIAEILENTLYSYRAENQLSRAMQTSPDLICLDRQHGDIIAERLAGYLKGYGSQLPIKDLKESGHLLYQMCSLLYYQFGDETIMKRERLLHWSRTMVHALLRDCLET
ncbi:MAG: TetR/AcrR family transcriptional regulator [Desulfobacterales bacterium]|nr:TetR/AcrR family transcriptional regulator [Desulfobacterales bacterium]